MASREISNTDDIIDSRDVIARIDDLESELADTHDDAESDDVLDMRAELAALQSLADEASVSPDWKYGVELVRGDYFETYAQDLAEDIGAIDRSARWPMNCTDWEQAARELKTDYFSVDFDGATYWIRA